jgi:hypothetical protein
VRLHAKRLCVDAAASRQRLGLFGQSVVVRGVAYAASVLGTTAAVQASCVHGAWISADPATIP